MWWLHSLRRERSGCKGSELLVRWLECAEEPRPADAIFVLDGGEAGNRSSSGYAGGADNFFSQLQRDVCATREEAASEKREEPAQAA